MIDTSTALEAELAAEDADQLDPIEVLAARELANLGFAESVVNALAQPLDWSRVKKKPGTKFDYIGHADMRRTLNRIFGYGGWGYSTDDAKIVSSGPFQKDGKEGFGAAAIAVVTLKLRLADGTWLEKGGTGEGYGTGYGPMAPFEAPGKAAKEAESDALKRAAMNLGDQFGLILYAKEEREQLQAEAEYNAPAKQDDIKALGALATKKGKHVETAQVLERNVREFGHVQSGKVKELTARLTPLPDAPAPGSSDASDTGKDDTSKSEGHAAAQQVTNGKPFEDGDHAANDEQIENVRNVAAKLGPPGLKKLDEGLSAQRVEYGGKVSAAWLDRQHAAIKARLAEAAAAVNGDAKPGADPADVAEAFGVEQAEAA